MKLSTILLNGGGGGETSWRGGASREGLEGMEEGYEDDVNGASSFVPCTVKT